MRKLMIALFSTVIACGWLNAADPTVGSVAPEFGGKTFYNAPKSETISLSHLRGRVVLIDFWATWCGPCVASIPHLIELHEKYHHKGLVIIGHTDGSSQDLPGFIEKKKIPYIISVGADIGNAYGVSGIPRVFVIDPDGKVAWEGHPGAMPESVITNALKNVRMPTLGVPSFEKPATNEKVAQIESAIRESGQLGKGIKLLEKLAKDKDADTASSATATLEIIAAWQVTISEEIDTLATSGDVYTAAELATNVADNYAGQAAAKDFSAKASTLKKDPGYAAGKEFQKLNAVPQEARSDPRFAKMVETFLKKYQDSFYATQAKELLN